MISSACNANMFSIHVSRYLVFCLGPFITIKLWKTNYTTSVYASVTIAGNVKLKNLSSTNIYLMKNKRVLDQKLSIPSGNFTWNITVSSLSEAGIYYLNATTTKDTHVLQGSPLFFSIYGKWLLFVTYFCIFIYSVFLELMQLFLYRNIFQICKYSANRSLYLAY